jgi:hypothetical protein
MPELEGTIEVRHQPDQNLFPENRRMSGILTRGVSQLGFWSALIVLLGDRVPGLDSSELNTEPSDILGRADTNCSSGDDPEACKVEPGLLDAYSEKRESKKPCHRPLSVMVV